LEKFLDGRLELTFGPITDFPQVPLAESAIGDPPCDLLNAPHIGVPTHEINEKLDDKRMFTHGFGGILLGQGVCKVAGVLLQLGAQRGLLVLKLPQRLKIGVDLVAWNRDLALKDACHSSCPRYGFIVEVVTVMPSGSTMSLCVVR
jgi:hypothetical protein